MTDQEWADLHGYAIGSRRVQCLECGEWFSELHEGQCRECWQRQIDDAYEELMEHGGSPEDGPYFNVWRKDDNRHRP